VAILHQYDAADKWYRSGHLLLRGGDKGLRDRSYLESLTSLMGEALLLGGEIALLL